MEQLTINDNVFQMSFDYHYYESPNFEPYNQYYAGFGSRQLKTMQSSLNQLALGYENFSLMKREYGLTEQEEKVYQEFNKLIHLTYKLTEEIRGFKRTNSDGELKSDRNYGNHYDKEYNGRRWVKPVDQLEKFKGYRTFTSLNDFYDKKNEVAYQESKKDIQSHIFENINHGYFFIHWIDYLWVSLIENDTRSVDGGFDIDVLFKFKEAILVFTDELLNLDYMYIKEHILKPAS
jgi:hypothetical protein